MMPAKSVKWHAHRDWAGWSFGWYPTEEDPRCLTLQHIRWHCFNLDVDLSDRHEWRVQIITRRNSLEEAQRKHQGLGPTPRVSVRNYAKVVA